MMRHELMPFAFVDLVRWRPHKPNLRHWLMVIAFASAMLFVLTGVIGGF